MHWAPSTASHTQGCDAAPNQDCCSVGLPGLESHFQEFLLFECAAELSNASCMAEPNLIEPSKTICMLCTQTIHNVDVYITGTDKKTGRKSMSQHACSYCGINRHNETSCIQEQQQARTVLLAACSSGLQRVRAGQTSPQNINLTGWAATSMGQGMLVKQPGGESQRTGAVNTCMHLVIRRNEAVLPCARGLGVKTLNPQLIQDFMKQQPLHHTTCST